MEATYTSRNNQIKKRTHGGDHREGTPHGGDTTPHGGDTTQRGYTCEGDMYMDETYTRKNIHMERTYT